MPLGFDCNTLYAAQAGNGYQITLDEPRRFVTLKARGNGVFWVRRKSAIDGIGTVPTSPIPGSSGQIVKGWLRIGVDEGIDFGREVVGRDVDGSSHVPASDRIAFVDVWCETGGDLIVNPS